ncbi:MAG: hypothetical protein WD063_15590 [Pirellulales bacterium]
MVNRRLFANARALRTWSLRCVMVAAVWPASALAASDIPLAEGTVVRFADVRDGIEALTRRDDYIKRMSPFDRQVRLRTDRDVSEDELVAFVAGHVVPWTGADIEKLTPLVEELARKIAPWKLKLPPVVLLVKTTGREEGGAAYCRGSAIVLPQNMVDGGKLARILPHELFHVLSSHNPKLRDALYATIGFQPSNEVQLPEPLRARKITNPDAPVIKHYITVTRGGRQIQLVPVLFSKTPGYDPARGGSLFTYLTFKLMAVENAGGEWRPVLDAGNPVLWDPDDVPGYHEQVGRNTRYIIHPEEILADNFVFLLDGRIEVPTPRVLEKMGEVLQAASGENHE